MRRALRRFVSTLKGPKKILFFVVVLLVCVVALCIGIYAQFFYKYSDTDALMLGINIGAKKTEEEIAILKSNFNMLFDNSLKINSENVKVNKIDNSQDIVYGGYEYNNKDENFFEVDAVIPILNINTDEAKKINQEIKTEFYDKANLVMRTKQGHSVYSVAYCAFVNEDVISIAIKSSLKENDKPEKVVVKTYTYAITSGQRLSFEDIIKLKETTYDEVQNTINTDVQKAYTNAKIISETFGNLYERDLKSDMYKIENTENYFLTQDGYVYIVYAYGNKDYTNEMDIIIF